MFVEIGGNARVEIPAVVVEAHGWVVEERFDVARPISARGNGSRHHVGHLHAGVVDVVLHFDRAAAGSQHTHERVAQDGVAQVTDMRGFVGIDVGVFDDDFAGD